MLLIRTSINSKLNLAKLNFKTVNLQKITAASLHFENETTRQFWDKNEKLKRPISPFTHYKPQVTTVLSITHRGTGLCLSTALYAFGVSQFLVNNNWSNQLVSLQSICPNVFLATKFLIIGSFYYHALNGVRHLAWDLGKGFQLKQLYASGYAVILLSVILTAITMANL